MEIRVFSKTKLKQKKKRLRRGWKTCKFVARGRSSWLTRLSAPASDLRCRRETRIFFFTHPFIHTQSKLPASIYQSDNRGFLRGRHLSIRSHPIITQITPETRPRSSTQLLVQKKKKKKPTSVSQSSCHTLRRPHHPSHTNIHSLAPLFPPPLAASTEKSAAVATVTATTGIN